MIGRLMDGRYEVRSRIARGGMATVYVATDLRLDRRVAIKVMHGHLSDDTVFKDRFIQEARSAARLAHPNVVNVFDQGQDGESAYLVMEYLPGMTLRDLLQEYKTLTPEQTMDIMEAVLSGLAAAHRAGIVHRDLKPENVLLADDGRIKIGDFGLARAVSANTATGQALLGTIAYLSPELVTRGIADTRSDIYAVGIMMYEMLAGAQPFTGDQPMQIAYQHANDTVPPPSEANPAVPVELDELVLWATAKDPEQRPRDAAAMLDQLFEAQNLMEQRGVVGTGTHRTVVMPAAVGPELPATAETQVIGAGPRPDHGRAVPVGAAGAAGVLDAPASAQTLARKADRRRRRGFVWLTFVLLLAAFAGGTGWYLSSTVPLPDVAGDTVAEATETLAAAEFEVNRTDATDPEVEPGRIIRTDPAPGSTVIRGSSIDIVVSTGPKLIRIGDYKEKPEDEVRTAFADFEVAEQNVQQFSDLERGRVLLALDSDGNELGATYPEQRPVQLVVSAGPIPDVAGQDYDSAVDELEEAGLTAERNIEQFGDLDEGLVFDVLDMDGKELTTAFPAEGAVQLVVSAGRIPDVVGQDYEDAAADLQEAGLTAERGADAFSDTVPAGSVTNVEPTTDPVRVGDAVTVTVSKGPDLVEVPNVVGLTRDEAKTTIANAGFRYTYSPFWDAVPNEITGVAATTPEAGTMQRRGSTISLGITASG
ncbi:Stk1 family PASTA domain-containing Ser/Thr kinase [Microbacteriaceae bacterium 4G12]